MNIWKDVKIELSYKEREECFLITMDYSLNGNEYTGWSLSSLGDIQETLEGMMQKLQDSIAEHSS